MLPPKIAFLLVSFSLGELGDGLNIFQGIYLVGIGWNESSVGAALSLMGLTSLIIQPWAGDWVDKTTIDRRIFLTVASVLTAFSASTILLVREGNTDHFLIFISKIIEGIASSFIAPCLAALTLASFGPNHFDEVMASNIMWGHIGAVVAAVLAGLVSYVLYPQIKYCFVVIGLSALVAIAFVKYLPQGNPLMGRGFAAPVALDMDGHLENVRSQDSRLPEENLDQPEKAPEAASYLTVFTDLKTCVVCATGFFFHFANANVLLVLGELMGQTEEEGPSRSAIPLIAGAIVTAQVTMAAATWVGDRLTLIGVGRKPLFLAGLVTLPIRCALIILLRNAGDGWLLFTQVFDGLGGGLCGLIHPLIVADIAFGTGRFNVLMGLTASCFGLGATLSNLIGQMVVEHFGHVTSLLGSFFLSLVPLLLFAIMPETLGLRTSTANKMGDKGPAGSASSLPVDGYVNMT